MNVWRYAAYFELLFGLFLILDAVSFHAISFDYAKFNLQFLDEYVSHAYFGIILALAGGKHLGYI